MKIFYASAFWVFTSICAGTIIYALRTDSWSLIRDFGFPLGALLFTTGQLWFDRIKHEQERKDKYWDKRFEYYQQLHELVGIINYKFSSKDLVVPEKEEFKDSTIGRIGVSLWELEDRGEILFNNANVSNGSNVSSFIKEIRKQFEIIRQQEIALAIHWKINQENLSLRSTAFEVQNKAKESIEVVFAECRKAIFIYLRVEA